MCRRSTQCNTSTSCHAPSPLYLSAPLNAPQSNAVTIVHSTGHHTNLEGCTNEGIVPLASVMWANVIQAKGQLFKDAKAFRVALYQYSISGLFKYRYKRNERGRIQAYCLAEGCPWFVNAVSYKNSNAMRVKDLVKTHKHCAEDECTLRPGVNSKHLATIIEKKIRSCPNYLPRQICRDMHNDHGMTLSYMQSWRAKQHADLKINGNVEDSYKFLPLECKRIVYSNPGSVAECTVTEDGRFKQLFVAYACSINGFLLGCRPILFVDSCFLSGPYKGALLSASAVDADNHMFPLAYGVVSSENYEDWLWFLQHVKVVVGSLDVTIVSDRHQALLASVPQLFGNANHAHCYRHLKENFSTAVTKLRVGNKEAKDHALSLLDHVAYARRERDYILAMEELTEFSTDLGEWVTKNGPEHWANSQFGRKRWDAITSNLAESFNAWLVNERHLHIMQLIHAHRNKLATMLYNKMTELSRWQFEVGPRIEAKLQAIIELSKNFDVIRYAPLKFRVASGNSELKVDLELWQCSCMEWSMTGIPCAHACAAIQEAKFNIYHFVELCYKRETQAKIYSKLMEPVEIEDMLTLGNNQTALLASLDCSAPSDLRPPRCKRPPGRPKEKRIESQFMQKRPLHCSRCSEPGHNRSRCPNPIADR